MEKELKDQKDQIKKEPTKEELMKIEKDKKEAEAIMRRDPNNVQIMKKGDYIVHILIEEVRNLIGKDGTALVYPSVRINCLGKDKKTAKVKEGCSTYTFNEHFYFERNNMSNEELDSEKIIIEVIDTSNNYRGDYLGIYEFDFNFIYNNKDHSVHNFWIALANPESQDIAKVRGFLKLSASVLNENDSRIELDSKETDDPNSLCVLPPQIKMEYTQVTIYILKGEQFPDVDSLISEKQNDKKCNPFVRVKYLGYEVETSVADQINNVITWNQILEIPITIPVVSEKLVLEVYDKNFAYNKILSSFELKIDDILDKKSKYRNFTYVPLYGAPTKTKGPYTNKMNANSEIGSLWKGRILMKINAEKTDNPRKAVKKLTDNDFKIELGKFRKDFNYVFTINLFEALFLPKETGEYSIRIFVEEKLADFGIKKSDKRNIYYNGAEKSIILQTSCKNVKDLPDVFIYLVYNDVNICFQRISAETFLNNEDVMVIKLLPDPSIGKIEEFVYSGIVKLKIKLEDKNDKNKMEKNNSNYVPPMVKEVPIVNQPSTIVETKVIPNAKAESSEEEDDGLNRFESTKEKLEKERKLKEKQKEVKKEPLSKVKETIPTIKQEEKPKYMIVANIHMSRHLISGDPDGTSDPYVVVKINELKKETSVKYNTVNCIWNESLFFENVSLDKDDKSTWPVMFFRVLDKDTYQITDDLLAYNYIWLSDTSHTINNINFLTPQWQQLHLPVSNRPQGQLLCSFFIIDMKQTDLITAAMNNDITPETRSFSCEINILGLRDLKPLSIMPVKKPYIAFDLNSINVSGKGDGSLKVIKTQPKNGGPNPTINAVINFDVRLPVNEVFMPDMQCAVYDFVLGGFINQMLGIFILRLTKIIRHNKSLLKENLELGEKFLEDLYNQNLDQANNAKNEINNLNIVSENNLQLESDSNKQLVNSDSNKQIVNSSNSKYNPLLEEVAPNDIVLDLNKKKDLISSQIENKKEFNPDDQNNFLIQPVYKVYTPPGTKKDVAESKQLFIEDSSKIPNLDLYKSVGYNKNKESNNKHYRRIYDRNLEDVEVLGLKSPFDKISLKRGKFIDKSEETGIFDALKDKDRKIIKVFNSNKNNTNRMSILEVPDEKLNFDGKKYGDFKGLIRITEKNELNNYNKRVQEFIDNPKFKENSALLKKFTNFDDISKAILVEREVVIRVYILELKDLANRDLEFGDNSNKSDPYIKLFLGTQEVNEKSNYKDNDDNCQWCKSYDFTTVLPGDGILDIEVWDYDPLFSDDLIGSTSIDIEDRFYDQKWRDIKYKPIEKRILYNPDYEGPQGTISMWIEIYDKKDKLEIQNKLDISPPPVTKFELRLIVWETDEFVPCMDDEDMSDFYVQAFIDGDNKQSTDMHYRCEKGNPASFNWRIILPLEYPKKNQNFKLNIQLMDRDLFSANDFACGNTLDIQKIVKDSYDLNIPVKFTESYWNDLKSNLPDNIQVKELIEFTSNSDDKPQKEKDKFWLQCYNQGKDGFQKAGRLLLSIEVLPEWKAKVCKVGVGRDEPNINPYLPNPIGRFQFALNPFKMLNQCVGERYRRKLYMAACCGLLIMYCVFVLPYIILHLTGEVVNPFNYISKS